MKKLAVIIASVLFLAGYNLNAQMHKTQKTQKPGMIQESMMHKGMSGMMCPMCGAMMGKKMPMKKYMMMVNMLPQMQEQLSLSDDQVEKLIDLQTTFKKQHVDYKAELTKKQMKMQALVKDMAAANELKQQMEACADVRIDMKIAAYETGGKMKAILTSEQRKKMESMMASGNNMMRTKMMNK